MAGVHRPVRSSVKPGQQPRQFPGVRCDHHVGRNPCGQQVERTSVHDNRRHRVGTGALCRRILFLRLILVGACIMGKQSFDCFPLNILTVGRV